MESTTLSASITHYSSIGTVTYFSINLFHSTTKSSWQLARRYSDFESLYNSLSYYFSEIPELPSKAFWKKFSSSFLDDRLAQLNSFLSVVLTRQDLLQTEALQEFLELKHNVPMCAKRTAQEIKRCGVGLTPLSVYLTDADISLMVLVQDPSQKLERLKTAILSEENSVVLCLTKNFDELWRININTKISCMTYSEELTMLFVGLEVGGISIYRIKTEEEYKDYEEYSYLILYTSSVIGIVVDFSTSDIFTCSSDKRLLKTSLLHEITLQELPLDSIPASFIGDLPHNRLYILDKKSGVTILDSNTFLPVINIFISDMLHICVSSLAVVYLGGSTGVVAVYKDNVAVTNFYLSSKVTALKYSAVRKEVYVGGANGAVSVWSRAGKLMSVWRAHQSAVVCVEVKGNKLISGSIEQFAIWELPVFWNNPEFEQIEGVEAEIQVKTVRVLTTQEKIKQDDLKGWDKS